jgi:hypothetical protein
MATDERATPALPSREVFPAEMPRLPNLWFYVEQGIWSPRGDYEQALIHLVQMLEDQLGLVDSFLEGVRNPGLYCMLRAPGEGSDFQCRIGPLQFYRDPQDARWSHWHQVHARFYVSCLYRQGCHSTEFTRAGRQRRFFLVPASVHYEVATEDPLHPYADLCPLCGITGEYQVPVDRSSQDYCEKIHDPLGVEFLLYGTIRGQRALREDGSPFTAIEGLSGRFHCCIEEEERPDSAPRRLARVFLERTGEA